jgi:hypothetical protein
LARIRDNQRRSRARRKDYLKELETKYRNCEQVGVSASTEIQAAAKGVVEENRRLRSLLKAYGVSDAEIDGASGNQGSIAADTLEAMASTRTPCGPGDGCQPAADHNHQQQLQPSAAPFVPSQLSSQPATRQGSFAGSHSAVSTPQYLSQLPSPAGNVEYTQTSGALCCPSTQAPMHFIPQNYGVQGGVHPTSMGGHQAPVAGPIAPHAEAQYNDYSGQSSCQIAANTIRTFSPTAGYELEQELGCRAPGEDCNVPNSRIFTVIDRYTVGAG